MSSEISTDTLPAHRAGVRDGDPGLQPWQLFTLAGLIGATIVVFLSRGQTPAGIVLLSFTIFTAAIVGVAAWRTLAPFTGSDERRDRPALGGWTRAALEREKTLALRSIKDLEFDRAMGKVSDKDFAEMSARLRGRAARLIRQLDAGAGYRGEIEKEVALRIGRSAAPRSGAAAALPEEAPVESRQVRLSGSIKTCVACSGENDADARFCKHCGGKLEPAA